MTVQREGRWLAARLSDHVAYEVYEGWFRLSFMPECLVSRVQAVAGLVLSEIAAQWDQLLWEDNPNTEIVWRLLAGQAKTLGVDVLDAVIRCEQSEWPHTAAEWAVWSR